MQLIIVHHRVLSTIRYACNNETRLNCHTMNTIDMSEVKEAFPEHLKMFLPPEPTTFPVKRIHSRHRRFIAPGAAWQLKVRQIIKNKCPTCGFSCMMSTVDG